MSIGRMISLAVLFCALMIAWMILMVLAIPFRVGINYISPVLFHRAIWKLLWSYILLPLFIFILLLFLILWYLYKILRKIPIVGSIVKNMTPFREMRNLCIMAFYDKLFELFYTNPAKSFPAFRDACMCVLVKSFAALGDEVVALYEIEEEVGGIDKSYDESSLETRVEDSAEDKSFTKAEYDEIKDEELQCILENTAPVASDLSQTERLKAMTVNQTAIVGCKIKSIANSFKSIAYASQKY